MSKTVFLGMSGGVDSSVSAVLLKEAGYRVVGVYMKNWSKDLPGMKCPWAEDLADAKRVAVKLGLDFRVFDFEMEYKQKVVDYMLFEFKKGHTPNPDIMCNQEIKFKLFYDVAREQGADLIATGHYANAKNGELLKAADENKDQTYFLYRVRGEALGRTLLPLGNFTKPEVREMAKERSLFTARKKDSQGICFVGKIGIRDFLKQFIPEQKPGKIINKNTGEVLGWHDGAIFYTLGQRHGLNIGGGLPFYVCGKNMQTNEVFVTTDINNGELWAKEINVSALHWINEKVADGAEIQVRIRHRAPLVNAKIFFENDGTAKIKLTDEQRAITSGQSVVFYSGEVCLGGGIVI